MSKNKSMIPVQLLSLCLISLIIFVFSGCTHRSTLQQEAKKNERMPQRVVTQEEKPVPPSELKKNIKTMTLEELQKAKEYYLAINNKTNAITYLEQIITISSDQQLLKDFRLELADLYFDQGTIGKANKMYTSYLALYPGSEHRAYAHYRAILCRFYETFSPDRDQTRTEETLILTQEYLNRSITDKEFYTAYVTDVENIQKQCCKKLFEHDRDIFRFYYKKGNYKAADVHLAYMKKNYSKLYKESEPELLTLECSVAEQKHDTTLLLAKQTELKQKFPAYHATMLAQQQPKKSYGNRF